MDLNSHILEIMSKELFVVEVRDPLWQVKVLFNNHYLNHVPVLEDEELVGMVSKIDISKIPITEDEKYKDVEEQILVSEVMTPEPVSVQDTDSIGDLVNVLTDNDFHAVKEV